MSRDGQATKRHRKKCRKFQTAEYGARALQKTDRRQTDGRATSYSERKKEVKKVHKNTRTTSSLTCKNCSGVNPYCPSLHIIVHNCGIHNVAQSSFDNLILQMFIVADMFTGGKGRKDRRPLLDFLGCHSDRREHSGTVRDLI